MASALMQWYEGLKKSPDPATPPRGIALAKALGHGTIGAVESVAIGAVMGSLSANMKNGLDFKAGSMSIPLDASAGLVSTLLAAKFAGTPWGAYLRTAADTNWGIFGFRHFETMAAGKTGKGAQLLANKAAKVSAAAGESDYGAEGAVGTEDPIIQFGKTVFANSQ